MPKAVRRWSDPAKVQALNTTRLDEEIRKLNFVSRWDLPSAIAFGRLALKVAIEDGVAAENTKQRDEFDYWDRTSALADRATAALNALLKSVGPHGVATRSPPVGDNRTTFEGRRICVRFVRRKEKTGLPVDQAAEMQKLIAARDVLTNICADAGRLKKSLSHTLKNEPDHAKNTFVFRLLEAWVFLTGNPPGLGKTAPKNPFLRFVEAAAATAIRSEVEDFWSALRWSRCHLKMLNSLSDGAQLVALTMHGPPWFANKLDRGTAP